MQDRSARGASFGLEFTSSVAIAGVLLVFCYLIVPSVVVESSSFRIDGFGMGRHVVREHQDDFELPRFSQLVITEDFKISANWFGVR